MDNIVEAGVIVGIAALMIWALRREFTRGKRAAAKWQQSVDAYAARDIDTAERALRACVKLAPTWAPAHRFLGRVLLERGSYREAEERVRFGADLEPRSADGYIDLAQLYMALPSPRESDSLDALEKALTCAPGLRGELH